jgi:plastocyanin
VRGPATVRILKGQTTGSFDLVGDTLGIDTLSVASALGYVVAGSPTVYMVDSLHVRPYSYPGVTNYTITPPWAVTAYAYDPADGQTRPLVKPLRVSLTSGNPATFTLDSGAVTIDSGQYYSYNHPDTLRFRGVDNVGARIFSTAPGSTPDSSNLIKVLPTPLQLNRGYPYTVGRGLRELNNSVSLVGGVAPSAVAVTLQRYNRAVDSLSTGTVTIPQGQSTSGYFELLAIDSTGTDSITASAAGYVAAKLSISPEAASLIQGGIPATRLTTDLPYTPLVYTGTRSRTTLKPFSPVSVTVVSTNPNVILIDSAGGTISTRGDTAVTLVDTTRTYGGVRVRFVGSGSARLQYSATGFATDSTPLVTVTGPTLHLSTGNQNVGVGQLLPGQYVYVDNPVTGTPLVVQLLKSDSLQPAASQAFTLSASSVTIPVNSTISNTFEIQGNSIGSAALTARAPAYSQSSALVSVSQPKLVVSPKNLSLAVGQVPYSVYAYTADQSGTTHIVAAALAVNDTSRAPTVVQPDSLVLQVPARLSSTSVGLRGFVKGTAPVIFTAVGYSPDTVVVAVDTGQLSLVNPPNGLGPGQVATQMYVQLSYTTAAAVVVNLASDNPNVLTVPSTVMIPANNSYAYFTVTGVGVGMANVSATATGVKPAAVVAVRISMPKFAVSLASTSNAGQKATVTVYAEDSLGNTRNLASLLTVSLASTNPNHAVFDSATIHIPPGTYYASTGVVFDTAGTYTITASLPTGGGYTPGTATTTTTGALVRMIAPTSFSPVSVTIKAGQYVTWQNNDAVTHTATSDLAGFNTGNIAPGASNWAYFGTTGTYYYHCTYHGTAGNGTAFGTGMVGVVIVQ